MHLRLPLGDCHRRTRWYAVLGTVFSELGQVERPPCIRGARMPVPVLKYSVPSTSVAVLERSVSHPDRLHQTPMDGVAREGGVADGVGESCAAEADGAVLQLV